MVIISFLFPFLLSVLFCLLRKISVFDLYIPNSYNNDSLYYYKTVASIVKYGAPRGFFGYNESRALIGGYGYWSPVIYFPWAVFGKIFGWNYATAIISNLVLFGTSFSAFIYMRKPRWASFGSMLALLSLFSGFSIHLLSFLPETLIASVLLLFFGFVFREADAKNKREKIGFGIGVYVCILFLTLLRPYLVTLFLFPMISQVKKGKKLAILWNLLGGAASLILYFVVTHFFNAPYFSGMSGSGEALVAVFSGSPAEAIRALKGILVEMLRQVMNHLAAAFTRGYVPGTQYVVAFLTAASLLAQMIFAKESEEKEKGYIYLLFFITVAVDFLACIIMMQKVNEGGRHLFVFAVVGMILLSEVKWDVKNIVLRSLLLLILIVFNFRGSYLHVDYDIPVYSEELHAEIDYLESCFEKENVAVTDKLGYENTLIWVAADGGVVTNYNELYAIPDGMAISCCLEDYVTEHIDSLQGKYLAVCGGGAIDEACRQKGRKEIARTKDLVIYQLH